MPAPASCHVRCRSTTSAANPGTGERSGGAETGDASADDEDARRGRRAQGPYPPVLGAMLRLTRNRLPGSYFSFTLTRRSKLVSYVARTRSASSSAVWKVRELPPVENG